MLMKSVLPVGLYDTGLSEKMVSDELRVGEAHKTAHPCIITRKRFERFVRKPRIATPTGYFPPCFFSTFAQASFNATVRLKTSAPGFESGSTQKYPSRSN